MLKKSLLVWDFTLHKLLICNRHYGTNYPFHLQGQGIAEVWKFLVFCSVKNCPSAKWQIASFGKPYNQREYLLKWIQKIALFSFYYIIMMANVLCAISEITLCRNSTTETWTTISVSARNKTRSRC